MHRSDLGVEVAVEGAVRKAVYLTCQIESKVRKREPDEIDVANVERGLCLRCQPQIVQLEYK